MSRCCPRCRHAPARLIGHSPGPQIFEGVIVSVPAYYATGSRCRGFAWALLAGACVRACVDPPGCAWRRRIGRKQGLVARPSHRPTACVRVSRVIAGPPRRLPASLPRPPSTGAANPIGGLLGLLALRVGVPTDAEYGVVYSLVAGMMTYIALGELLPAARRYDPDDRVATKALLAGLALMSATLVLLAFVGAHD